MEKTIENLIKKVRRALGAPQMEVELTDQQICDNLDFAIEDYAEKVQNWLIKNQWATLYGKGTTNLDLAYALSVRTMDMNNDFSYWFSKEVGLQQNGPWELKKDFVKLEEGKQDYIIPAGREINKVLYCNPSTSQAALYANYGGLDMLGFAGGYGSAGGASYGPMGGFYIAQAADVAYMATDLAYKTRLLRGDLFYKVTGGPNGTKILHLYSTPGSKLSFGSVLPSSGIFNLTGSEVWYTYYDVQGSEDAEQCRKANKDILLTPDQVPLEEMDYDLLNYPTKILVRKLLIALCKKQLGSIRGKFSGRLSIMEAEAVMDYNMLISQGEKEYEDAMKSIEDRLKEMSPNEILKQQAEITESMYKIMSGKPLGIITA